MSARVVLPQAVYRHVSGPRELQDGLKLRSLEWALYFSVSGSHTAAELGRQLRADSTEVHEALARLVTLGLIEEQELDATEYVRAMAAAGDRNEKTLREFLVRALKPTSAAGTVAETSEPAHATRPAAVKTSVAVLPASANPRPQLREAPEDALTPRATPRFARMAQPSFGFKPLPLPDHESRGNRKMAGSRKLSIRALMSLIEGQADSRESGQLDIYRVFVRVDTLLLRRNGIDTLRFAEDRLIGDPELEQALVRSVKKTLGLDCPESLWVEVA